MFADGRGGGGWVKLVLPKEKAKKVRPFILTANVWFLFHVFVYYRVTDFSRRKNERTAAFGFYCPNLCGDER